MINNNNKELILKEVAGLPILLEVDTQGQKAIEWARENSQSVQTLLEKNGALLIRGLRIPGSKPFSQLLETLFGQELLTYSNRSTPRTELRGNVYTATEYHSDQVIAQHNENSYTNKWAMRLGFLCLQTAESGGATPISDSRLLYQKLPREIIERFEKHNIKYVRNYSDIDVPWQEVFQTESRSEVEHFCSDNNIEFTWLDNGGLRTSQVNQATAIHPITGEKVWFNQAHLFHISNLEESTQKHLLEIMSEDELPRNTYYGDGTPIEAEVLQLIRDLYEETKVSFTWQKGDLLLLDNMLFTHGRESFTGERKVLVGMASPMTAKLCETSLPLTENQIAE